MMAWPECLNGQSTRPFELDPASVALWAVPIHQARAAELGAAYESAWDEWDADAEASQWESTIGDGLSS